jgi:hypothetical protein
MLVKGILATLQVLFLPGILLSRLIKVKKYFLVELIVIISLSLIFNLFLVVVFVSLHIYSYISLLIVPGIEIGFIIFVFRKKINQKFLEDVFNALRPLSEKINRYFRTENDGQHFPIARKVLRIIFFVAACGSLIWIFIGFINNIGTIFNSWDAVVSYNRWATEWSHGLYPTGACEYPQLLPVNWSITYVLIQSNIGFFAKMIQGVFPVLLFIFLFDLALSYKSIGLMGLLWFIFPLFNKLAPGLMFEGYMDVALATMVFISFYILLIDYKEGKYSEKTIWVSFPVIVAAALIKQPGVIAFAGWALANIILMSLMKKSFPRTVKSVLPQLLTAAGIIAAWYVFALINNQIHSEVSCIAFFNSSAVNDLTQNFFQSTLTRLNLIGPYLFLIPAMVISILIKNKAYLIILLSYVFPFLLVSFFYGLAQSILRYLMPISIFMIIGAAFTVDLTVMFILNTIQEIRQINTEQLVEKTVSGIGRFLLILMKIVSNIRVWVIGLILIILVGVFSLIFPNDRFVGNFTARQMHLGDGHVDTQLYEFYKDKSANDLTLSWYPYISFLPGLENRAIRYYYTDIPSFQKELQNPRVKYLLFPSSINAEVMEFITAKIENGDFKIIWVIDNVNPYEMVEIIQK